MILSDKLNKGDEIRIIAPSKSIFTIDKNTVNLAINKLEEYGFKISFGKNIFEEDKFGSSSIKSRLEDLHEAFLDKNVKGIICGRGGFNSNQLLSYIDYEIIKNNPKIICGYSDITVLCNAIYAITGLITYSGPNLGIFSMKNGFEYINEYFLNCLFNDKEFYINPSKEWSEDNWRKDQENRNFIENEGYWIINEGNTKGVIIGGNLCSFNLLQGTRYMPKLDNSIIFIEDDNICGDLFPLEFDRNLQSLIQQIDFSLVKGLVFGRFQISSKISLDLLKEIINSKKELKNIPIIGNVDFGHTYPIITFPIGGIAQLNVENNKVDLKIITH